MSGYPNINNEPELLMIRTRIDEIKNLNYQTEKHDHENILKSLKIDNEYLQDRRVKPKPKFELGQLVRTADINRDFSKEDSTIFSYKLYRITEVIHDTTPSYRID